MKQIKFNCALVTPNRTTIRKFLKKVLGQIEIINLYRTSKTILGEVDKKNERLFFKIKSLNEGKKEINNYLKICSIYPVPKLEYFIKFKDYCINIYRYEKSIKKDSGLFLDYLYKERLNIKKFMELIKIYKRSFRKLNTYSFDYNSKKYFSKRVIPRIKNGFLVDHRISRIIYYKVIINGEEYIKSTKDIVDDVIKYFKKPHKELCFLTQGDPITINLGTKPIFFDFETSGLNPLIGEFSIFLWAVFIAESYYYPKYHRESYRNRPIFLRNIRSNKPKMKFKIDHKNKILAITLKYKLSRTKEKMILYYLKNFVKNVAKSKANELLEKTRYFLPMRILATFDIKSYSLEDVISSISFLHIFCNYKIAKSLNRGYSPNGYTGETSK